MAVNGFSFQFKDSHLIVRVLRSQVESGRLLGLVWDKLLTLSGGEGKYITREDDIFQAFVYDLRA